jgi:hypothetical protein
MGPGRTIEAVYRAEREAKGGRGAQRPNRHWYAKANEYRWREVSEAWDQELVDQKEAAIKAAQEAAEALWREKIMGPTETLARLSDHGRNDLREFFKISERWTEHPLPTEEVLKDEMREVTIREDQTEMRTFYLVKSVVLDLEALIDPVKSHRVKKFADSPKNGVSIELYDADDAIGLMARHHKLLTDTVDMNMYANTKGYIGISPDDWDEADASASETEP